ncbi:MAG: hypothetical protein QM499_01215 [Flavobacteriaceae bacterium]
MKIQNIPIELIFKELKLKEHTLYKVKVKSTENNVPHIAFLFTGFKSGGYCEIYVNNYEQPMKMQSVYSIKIIKELTNIK